MGCSDSKEAAEGAVAPQARPPTLTSPDSADAAPVGHLVVNKEAGDNGSGKLLPDTGSKDLNGIAEQEEEDASGKMKFQVQVFNQDKRGDGGFDKKAKPRRRVLKTSSYLGSQLLDLAKKHPALQTVAFMMGAVTCHALSARSLKLDASRIAKLIMLVEQALVKLGTVAGNNLGDLSELQAVLDDAMKVMEKLRQPKSNSVVDETIADIVQSNVMQSLRDRLVACVQSLDESTIIAEAEIKALAQGSFKESAAIKEALVESGIESLRGKRWSDPEVQEAAQKAEAALHNEGFQRKLHQVDSLLDDETMETVLAEGGRPSEPNSPGPRPADATGSESLRSAIIHSQVAQMQAMVSSTGMELREFVKKWPLGQDEAERLLTVEQNHLVDKVGEVDVSDVTLSLREHFKAAYVAAYVVAFQSIHLLHCRADGALLGKEPGTQVEQKGRVQARKFSICQHTIEMPSEERIIHLPLDGVPDCFDATIFDSRELQAADFGVASMAERLATPGADPQIQDFVSLVKKGEEVIASGAPIQHSGAAIVIHGQKVGALCMLHPKDTWTEEGNGKLLTAADEVARRLVPPPA